MRLEGKRKFKTNEFSNLPKKIFNKHETNLSVHKFLLRWSENIKVWRALSLCQTKPYGLLLIEALQYIRWNSCFVSFPEYLSMESIYIAEHMVHLLSSLGIYFSTHTLSRPTCWAALFLLKESHFFFICFLFHIVWSW